jgi:heme exporter protein C
MLAPSLRLRPGSCLRSGDCFRDVVRQYRLGNAVELGSARETTILILLLIYAAYFALRSALDDVERRRRLSAVYNLFAAVTMPFLLFVAPRMAESTLHPNCAFIQGSHCDGVWLEMNGTRVGQLGDVVLALQGIEQRGDLAVVQVEVRMPGLRDVALLTPSFELSSGKPADRPEFPVSSSCWRLKGSI